MDVILSWSGEQSRKVAEALKGWLTDVLPGLTPWISSDDITKGSAWFPALLGRLEAARLCIICVTPENARSPWLYFEAGAIAGKSTDARICSYLIGIDNKHLSGGPLSQYQTTAATKTDTWKLVRDINKHLQSGAHNEILLEGNFEQKWGALESTLDAVIAGYKNAPVREVSTSQLLRPLYQLSRESIQLLIAAAADQHGVILTVRTLGGFHLQVGGKQFMKDPKDPREVATWQGAVRQLLQNGLLENRGNNGELFGMTAEGYRVADELKNAAVGPTEDAA